MPVSASRRRRPEHLNPIRDHVPIFTFLSQYPGEGSLCKEKDGVRADFFRFAEKVAVARAPRGQPEARSADVILCSARRTRPGDHSPGLSSKLYVRLSHSYSFPAVGPCHGTPRALRTGLVLRIVSRPPTAWGSAAPSSGVRAKALPSLHSRRRCVPEAYAFGPLCLPSAREPRRPIPRLSRGPSLLGSSHPPPHPPDRLLPRGEAAGGYSVPDGRLSLRAGRHSSPGGCWGECRRTT